MYNVIGERLKILRRKNNVSQQELAVSLNVNAMTIVKWEKGQFEPSLANLRQISKFFNINIDYLIGEDAFSLFLIVQADKFFKAQKFNNIKRNNQTSLAQWIIYWNDYIDIDLNYANTLKSIELIKEIDAKIGYCNECENVKLTYPEDYNDDIIKFIINFDFNSFNGDYIVLTQDILNSLPTIYSEKPDLYKYLLGYEK